MLTTLLDAFRRPSRPAGFRPQLEVLEQRSLLNAAPVEGHTWTTTFSEHVDHPPATAVRVEINWGDGKQIDKVQAQPAGGQVPVDWTATVSHEYDHWGHYTVHVLWYDQNNHLLNPGPADQVQQIPDVQQAPVTIQEKKLTGPLNREQQYVVATGRYDRPEFHQATDGDLLAYIWWGDTDSSGHRNETTVPVHVNADGTFEVKAAHKYTSGGAGWDWRVNVTLDYIDQREIDVHGRHPESGAANTDKTFIHVPPPARIAVNSSAAFAGIGAHWNVIVTDPETGAFHLYYGFPRDLSTPHPWLHVESAAYPAAKRGGLTGDMLPVSYSPGLSYADVVAKFAQLEQHVEGEHTPYGLVPDTDPNLRAVTSDTYAAYLIKSIGGNIPWDWHVTPGISDHYINLLRNGH